MNFSYYINDFLENNEIYWCRCIINRHFAYAIISDMFFIILHIVKENKQKGKMKFFLEINKLKEIKVNINEKKINLTWEEDALLKDIQIKQEIVFENTINLNEFNDRINKKKNKLNQLFTRFDDNEIRNSPSSILRMINFYEILFDKIKSKLLEKKNKKQDKDKEKGKDKDKDKEDKNKENEKDKDKDKGKEKEKEKEINDGLYYKNILIIYYKKALNLYCLENKNKDKFNERLISLYSDEIIK